MSDVPNRDKLEGELSKALGKLLASQMGKLLELMGDPPDINKVPPEFWDEAGEEFAKAVRPFLQRLFESQTQTVMGDMNIGVAWDLVNERAAAFASQYTFDLVKGINETSRKALQDAVSAYYRDGLTIGELEQRLTSLYGPIRASLIAVTEVTRASTQAEHNLMLLLKDDGINMREIYQTNADEKVCPRCSPMNGKEIKNEDEYPPRHPGCRCWTNLEYVE